MLRDTLGELKDILSDVLDDLTSGAYDEAFVEEEGSKEGFIANLEEAEVYLVEAQNYLT